MEDQAIGDQMVVLDDLPLLIPAVLESARNPGVKRPAALNWAFEPWSETGGTSAGTRPPIRY